MLRPLIVLAVLAPTCVSLPCLAQSDRRDPLTGPITAISPAGDFDVSGHHVLGGNAHLCVHVKGDLDGVTEKCNEDSTLDPKTLFIGEQVKVSGNSHQPKHGFAASKIFILPPATGNLSGTAIIDSIPVTQSPNPAERLLRADGYLLRITPESKLTFGASLGSLADISTDQWIQYTGALQADGTVRIDSAAIFANTVSSREAKLRKETDYDPTQVPYEEAQDQLSTEFLVSYYKHIGPWPDPAMQSRVQRIGNSLVPAWQRALPGSDPAKINFRFAVVNQKNFGAGFNLPSGVILLTRQVVERIPNDDQLAALIADSMAQVLEKDSLRMTAVDRGALATELAGDAAGIFLPGLDLATGIVGNAARNHVRGLQLAQSSRVSLCLLHDAGYDIQQAPLAWWVLAGKKDEPIEKIGLPVHAEHLYNLLGLIWRNPAINTGHPASGSSTAAITTPAAPQN
jgi:hypothetical protein